MTDLQTRHTTCLLQVVRDVWVISADKTADSCLRISLIWTCLRISLTADLTSERTSRKDETDLQTRHRTCLLQVVRDLWVLSADKTDPISLIFETIRSHVWAYCLTYVRTIRSRIVVLSHIYTYNTCERIVCIYVRQYAHIYVREYAHTCERIVSHIYVQYAHTYCTYICETIRQYASVLYVHMWDNTLTRVSVLSQI